MKKKTGIALVTTLLIMVAIMALGVGALFMSQLNLKISENNATHNTAKFNADAGMDVALVGAKAYYNAHATLPTSLTLIPSPSSNITYALASTNGYTRSAAGDWARVRVVGRGANSSRYTSEAIISTSWDINPAFKIGLASEGPISVTGGGGAEYTNAAVHSNVSNNLTGYSAGVFHTCPAPGMSYADCPVSDPPPVSTSVQNCGMVGCQPYAPPIAVDPAFTLKRNKEIAWAFGLATPPFEPTYYVDANGQRVADGAGGYLLKNASDPSKPINLNPNAANNSPITGARPIDYAEKDPATGKNKYCDVVYSNTNKPPTPPATISASLITTGARICAKDGLSLNFPSGSTFNMTGVSVIADGDITFGKGTATEGQVGTLTNTKLISRTTLQPTATDAQGGAGQGGVFLKSGTGDGLHIYSGANTNVGANLIQNNDDKVPYFNRPPAKVKM